MLISQLEGPIVIFGAGGFIGVNLLSQILAVRDDVYGVCPSPHNSWRILAYPIPLNRTLACDIQDVTLLTQLLHEVRPRTVFQLSAYGAYSKQNEYRKIYATNFNAVVDMVEIMKAEGFSALVQAGSSSEYGLNAKAPDEDDELIPNSHYAVSKVATHYALKYYGRVEKLPVVNLRIYSVYGPWEEPDRLIPQLLCKARQGAYPPLVQPGISRDFIHVDDVCSALVAAALVANRCAGRAFNIGTGLRTTLGDLAETVGRVAGLHEKPAFGSMPNRRWDMADWYSQPRKAKSELGWASRIPLEDGLRSTLEWQREIGFDVAQWNWTRL